MIFLAELTKFRLTPLHVILHCIKFLMEDFTPSSIEVLCALLECCGRYLYRLPDTSEKMQLMLDTLVKKKKTATNLDTRILLMLENSYYSCKPPEYVAKVEKTRTPLELYMRKLLLVDLNKNTCEKVLKSLRKLSWKDKKVSPFDTEVQLIAKLKSILTHPWKIHYNNLHLFAMIVSGLHRYHPEFGVSVVDTVLEEIQAGLEVLS